MINKIYSYLLIFTLLIGLSPFISLGQSIGDMVDISIDPIHPGPGQQVTVHLQSLSLDLNNAKITWSVNGITKKTEVGLKDFYLTAGPAGKDTAVTAQITAPDGTVVIRNISFIPAGVDLLFEALSYTPPFYKGKALNPDQGSIIVVAFPEIFDQNGRKLNTQELTYNWKKDDIVVQNASGLGKNYLTFTGSVPVRDAKISVSVSSKDGQMTADKTIIITNTQPKIIFYENSPVYGIMMNKAIKNSVNMLINEFSVLAVPYFFSAGYAVTPDLSYEWTMNGNATENQEIKNSFTTRLEKSGSGTANIGLKVSHLGRIFQFTNNNYSINFSKE